MSSSCVVDSLKRKRHEDDGSSKEKKERKKKKKERREAEAGEQVVEASSEKPLATERAQTTATPSPSASTTDVEAYFKKHSVTVQDPSGHSPQAIVDFAALFIRIPDAMHNTFASFKEPTPIQACSWPPALDGKDVVGIAETGR
jgi:ATP-dependent RNA helicase DBP3